MDGSAGVVRRAVVRIALVGLLTPGCSTSLGVTGVVLSNLKSPVRYRASAHFPINKPLDRETYLELLELAEDRRTVGTCARRESGGLGRIRRTDCTDAFEEFQGRAEDTLVAVAISGGGSRAARLAAHALAILERRYNALSPDGPPMVRRIAALSTVSGGSLYAYHVARRLGPTAQYEVLGTKVPFQGVPPPPPVRPEERGFFQDLTRDTRTDLGTRQLGTLALGSIAGNYWGLGTVINLFTDWSYLDHMAKGLEFARSENLLSVFLPVRLRSDLFFSQLPETPRFYFNTTALETGEPLVLTQRITNAPRGGTWPRSARLDVHANLPSPAEENCLRCDVDRPLRSGLTLEEIGSSPANFRVAWAAAASAAFPFGVEPLRLRKYQYLENAERFVRTEDVLSLVDGGVYDNSGLTALVDLYEYLQRFHGVRHFVLIAINADATGYDHDVPERSAALQPWYDWLQLGSPVPSLFSAADSLELIHFSNKRRGEDVAWARLAHIQSQVAAAAIEDAAADPKLYGEYEQWLPSQTLDEIGKYGSLDPKAQQALRGEVARSYRERRDREPVPDFVHYFPINLAQLSPADPHQVEGGGSSYELVNDTPTGYWLRRGDEENLEAAAARLAATPQHPGWAVGPECDGERASVARLDEAFAFALIRAGQRRWEEPLRTAEARRWCEGWRPAQGSP